MSDEEVNEYEQVVQVEEAQAIAKLEGFCREKKTSYLGKFNT